MTVHTISNSFQPQLTILSHPSNFILKDTRPIVDVSDSGFANSSKQLKFAIKSKQAQHSASSNKDVVYNGAYQSSVNINNIIKTPSDELPPIDQQGGICQTVPFLHMIQSQLDFPINYESLWDCLPAPDLSIIPKYTESLLEHPKLSETQKNSYKKLAGLLFSNTCFPVGERAPKCVSEDDLQLPGFDDSSADCSDPCLKSIRIQAVKLSPISNEQELCERLNTMGPQPAAAKNSTAQKLKAMVDFPLEYPTWDSVKNLSEETLNQLYGTDRSGHAVTITSCDGNGMFTIKNSWGSDASNTITLSWSDLKEYFAIYLANDPDKDLESQVNDRIKININLMDYFPKVIECASIANFDYCKDQKCRDIGYDKVKESTNEEECECECDTVTNSNSDIITKVYDEIEKKCECPEVDSIEYELSGENCDRVYTSGSWCHGKWCDTDLGLTFYSNGTCSNGTYDIYSNIVSQYSSAYELPIGAFRKDISCEMSACNAENIPCDNITTTTPTIPTSTPFPYEEYIPE